MGESSNILNQFDPKGYFVGLAETIPNVILLVDPIHLKIKYFNRLYPGYKAEDVLGADVFSFILPEHAELYRKALSEIVNSLQKKTIDIETSTRANENGKIWYNCTISPMLNEAGEIENILLNWRDITSTKLHEIEIHNKEEKLYAIINNTKDMIMSIDQNLNITEYNSVLGSLVERGYGKTNLSGTCVLDFIDPKRHQLIRDIYARVFKGEVVNDIARFETHSGSYVYNETSYHPINNFEQVVTGISIFSKDITDRVLGEQKLKNTLKEREVLLSEIHHRIKNNLALVSSMLQLKEMNLENEAVKEALKDSRQRVKTTALVHEMLYRNESFDNLKLMEYVPELFKNVNINDKVMLDLAGDDYTLDLNKALPFGLMLHELMMNSFKHSFKGREQSKLKIRSHIKGEVLNIEYCDCSGTFPDDVEFKDTSTTGLMLIHTFIEQLNGSIELINKEPPSYNINIPLS